MHIAVSQGHVEREDALPIVLHADEVAVTLSASASPRVLVKMLSQINFPGLAARMHLK